MSVYYLAVANICVWVFVGGYVYFLGRRQGSLEQRIRQLEMLDDEK